MTPIVVPAAPIVIPVALLGFAFMMWRLHRAGALSPARTVVAVITCAYGAAVLQAVLLPFPVRVGAAREGMAPWHAFLQVVPFYDSDPIGYVLNVALFVPLGVLLPVVARVSSLRRAVAIGFLVSLFIELVQFVLVVSVTSGRVADVDDLMANTVGTAVGFALFRALTLLPTLARLTVSATWPSRDDGPREHVQGARP